MFNSDVLARLAVAVDLVNAHSHGELPGSAIQRPDHIFQTHGYLPPADRADWEAVARIAEPVREVLHLVAAREDDRATRLLNAALRRQHIVPQLEADAGRWLLHFHPPSARFAEGWSAGISAALAIAYSTAESARIGVCVSADCTNLFLDRGRNQQRRFCSLQCQNRAKSNSYRRRRVAE